MHFPSTHWRWTRLAVVLVLFVLAWCVASDVWACPTCKDGVAENDPQGQALAAGFYYSILFMMSAPFVVLGALGMVFYRSVHRAKIEHDQPLESPAEF